MNNSKKYLTLLSFIILIGSFGCVSSKPINPRYADETNLMNESMKTFSNSKVSEINTVSYFQMINKTIEIKPIKIFDDNKTAGKITLKNFQTRENTTSGITEVYVLVIVENMGKKQFSTGCSDLKILDSIEREFELKTSYEDYFNQETQSASHLQPGLAVYIECTQTLPIETNLSSIVYETLLYQKQSSPFG